MTQEYPLVEIFFFDAGGGHRNAATALQQSIEQKFPNWSVRLVNLQNLLTDVDPLQRISSYSSQDLYNGLLKRGWTYGSTAMLRGMQKAIKWLSPLCEARLQAYWRQQRPDIVVSVIPNFNGIMCRALAVVYPDVPYVTVMTDFADCPPHFWQVAQDQWLICGSDKAVAQARVLGYGDDRVLQMSGMILKPKFYDLPATLPFTREDLGLAADIPTALIMFGGYASTKVLTIVSQLEKASRPVQAIVLCGHNEILRKQLAGKPHCHTVGFTDKVDTYMRLADFFIGKPGPGSISEALHIGLPVIVESNRQTMPQERYNVEWVAQNRYGIGLKKWSDLPATLDGFLGGVEWQEMKRRIGLLDNKAVFEVPTYLEEILKQAQLNASNIYLSKKSTYPLASS